MNLVEPGSTVTEWDVHEVSKPSESEITELSLFDQLAIALCSVQPMQGECGMLFKMRYQPKMLAESEIPPVD